MQKGLQLPKETNKIERINQIEGILRILFRKDSLSMCDVMTARNLTDEYKRLTDWKKQKETRLVAMA